jgi:hypothetical protein
MGNVCNILAGNPEQKRTLDRTRRRWKENIKMSLQCTVIADSGSTKKCPYAKLTRLSSGYGKRPSS